MPALKENDGKSKPTSLKERMEQHRANAVCDLPLADRPDGLPARELRSGRTLAQGRHGRTDRCHLDPLGRRKIDGPNAFRQFLLDNRTEFVRTLIEKLFTFALGRGPGTTTRRPSGSS